MNNLTSCCVWKTTDQLLTALHDRFGDPLDAYVNGSQVWLREDGPNELTLEWRLHPVAGYQRPENMATETVFSDIVFALKTGETPTTAPAALWDGLEVFSAYDEEIEPLPLAAAASSALGLSADATGLVDHYAIGKKWEASRGQISIIDLLFAQLRPKG